MLEVSLTDLNIHRRKPTMLHNVINLPTFVLYVVFHWSHYIINF